MVKNGEVVKNEEIKITVRRPVILYFPKGIALGVESSNLVELGFSTYIPSMRGNAIELVDFQQGLLKMSLKEYFGRLEEAGVKIEYPK